jgi:hypothetical protein
LGRLTPGIAGYLARTSSAFTRVPSAVLGKSDGGGGVPSVAHRSRRTMMALLKGMAEMALGVN